MTSNTAPSACPPFEALHDASAEPALPSDLASHVATCDSCRALLDSLREDHALAAELAAADAATRIARAATRIGPGSEAAAAELAPGARIAGHTIRGVLGAGAMGMVYLAEQDHPRRPVALKLIRADFASADTLRRFDHEAAALALLKHPGIAQVYQAGSAAIEGSESRGPRPFMAMELVEGVSLDQFVKSRNPSRPERLRLVAALADAVEHAHRRGVIHRDLKPSNIVVDREDAAPKILDFGIAKLTAEAPGPDTTQPGGFVGTFAYAAPEQVAGDPSAIDARADVFALGVILYELLVGQRPFELGTSLADAVQAITEAKMIAPSMRGVMLDGELMTILSVALAPAAERRYQSAAALAEDVRRYLDKRPLRARPDSTLYTLRKAIARHPYRAATAAAFIVLALSAGAVSLSLHLQASRAAQAKSRLLDAIVAAWQRTNVDDDDTQRVTTLSDVFDQADAAITSSLADLPEERDVLQFRLAQARLSHRELEQAAAMLEQVASTRRTAGESKPAQLALAEALHDLGRARYFQGQFEPARDHLAEAHAIRAAVLGADDRLTIQSQYWLGASYHGWKKYDEAEPYLRAAAEAQERLAPDSPEAAEYLNGIAACVRARGEHRQALDYAMRALRIIERTRSPDHKHVAVVLGNIAANLITLEDYDQADLVSARALEIRNKWYGPDDPRVADTLVQRAGLKLRIGKRGQSSAELAALDEAAEHARRALEIRQRIHKGDHESVAEALSLLGQIRMRRQQFADACPTLRAAMEMRARMPRGSDGDLGHSESLLGECLLLSGRAIDAEPWLRSGLDKLRQTYGPTHARTRDAEARLKTLLEARP